MAPREGAALFVLLALSLALNAVWGPEPYTYHPDELRLVRGAGGTGDWDWSEPSLLYHLGRQLAALVGDGSPASVATSGRLLVALLGAVAVALSWRLARDALAPPYALLAAGILAASPLLSTSAHYFAPEVPTLAASLWAIVCLARLLETDRPAWAVLLGVAAGAAASTHYGGALVLVLLGVATTAPVALGTRLPVRRLALAAGVAVLVFVLVDAGLFLDPTRLLSGPWRQIVRLVGGDHLYVSGLSHWFTFHLVVNLRPGVTLPVLVVAGPGAVIAASRWRELPPGPRLVLLYGALTYVVAELVPLKPTPGSAGYVLAVVPALATASAMAVEAIAERMRGRVLRWLPAALALVLIASPAQRSVRILEASRDDTRRRADAWIALQDGRVLREPHSSARPADVASVATLDLDAAREGGVTHVVASSFVYDTFARGSRLAGQRDYVYERYERYQELFEYPYIEFAPDGPSFEWSNPTLRVLDIRERRPPGRPPRSRSASITTPLPRPGSPGPPDR